MYAGIYSAGGSELSKTKRTTKSARGPLRVVQRLRQCIFDALDEADLGWGDLVAVGLNAAAELQEGRGAVRGGPFGPDWFELRDRAAAELGVPVVLATPGNAGACGIFHQELRARPGRMAAIMLDDMISVGVLSAGQPCALDPLELAPADLALDWGPNEEQLTTKQLCRRLRQRIRAGDNAAVAVLRETARRVTALAGRVQRVFAPEVVVVGGVPADELLSELQEALGDLRVPEVHPALTFSALGRSAWLAGSALLAREAVERAKFSA